jgi:hypothetical protein
MFSRGTICAVKYYYLQSASKVAKHKTILRAALCLSLISSRETYNQHCVKCGVIATQIILKHLKCIHNQCWLVTSSRTEFRMRRQFEKCVSPAAIAPSFKIEPLGCSRAPKFTIKRRFFLFSRTDSCARAWPEFVWANFTWGCQYI